MNIAVILAGGKGVRMGTERPKQFLEIDGTPVIVTTAKIFEEHPGIDAIYIICLKEHCIFLRDLLKKYGFKKVKNILPGGETRQASSFIAVDYLYRLHAPSDIVLIHDAARPGVDSRIISENIAAAEKNGACNTVIPSQDTILVSRDGVYIHEYTDRDEMYLVQTPQSFRLQTIYDAHMACKNQGGVTDDCSLVQRCGGKVSLVMGDKKNMKITSPEDLLFFEKIKNAIESSRAGNHPDRTCISR